MNKTPSEMTQQELYLEIARLANENDRLKRTKKFGLVWENKNDAKVEEMRWSAPILVEDSTKRVINDPNDVNHVLINGDNFQAMTALRATHAGKVDVIYIDPPYNTGNKDFIYNDRFVDAEDGYRHSLWLSFMQKRLILARELLSETGVIFVSIDDNEQARLRLLMDDIFGAKNFVANLPAITNMKGNNDQFAFAGTHEYVVVYAKTISAATFGNFKITDESKLAKWENDDFGIFKKGANLKATGVNAPRSKRPNLFFPVFLSSDDGHAYVSDDDKPEFESDVTILPITDGKEMSWRWSKQKFQDEPHNLIVSGTAIYKKQRPEAGENPSVKPKSLLYKPEYSSGNGTSVLKSIFGNKIFNNPKPVDLIKDLVGIAGGVDSVILDFFAGSGTTAHAVAELNKEDGGKRQCILITDGGKTETTGESSKNAGENAVNIAEEITYERVKRVLTGKDWADGKEHEPLGGNLFYLNTVVKYVGTIDAKSKEPYFCPSNSTTFSLDTGLWHPILEEVGVSAEYPHQEHDYKLFALPKGEDGKQNYALTINASDWEFTAFKEWFDKNMPENSTVFLYADNYSHGGCEWMEELEMVKDPRLAEVNITKRLVNNHNWVAHSFLKTDI